jgi:2-oxoglutarate dehydrogenase complex dehydrogenase (E1) component-like enzyme
VCEENLQAVQNCSENTNTFLCLYRNMGAYAYVLPRIMTATREINKDEKRPRYVGRSVSAAPATGMGLVHQAEYQEIIDSVFGSLDKEGLSG